MEAIVMGMVSGAVVAGSGYLKNKPKYDFEGIDPVKAGKTIVLGAIVGGMVGATGMSPDIATTFLASAGITVVVENLLKSVYRKLTG
jgi:hypothetical protein